MVNGVGTELAGVEFLAPILVFFIVAIVVGALLRKTKLFGDNVWIDVFLALSVAILFVIVTEAREVVLDVTPWFAVMLVALFFILMIVGFIGKTEAIAGKGLGWFFVILLGIVFLTAIISSFYSSILPYLPGPSFGFGGNPEKLFFFGWLYSPQVSGTFWLIVSAVVVGWILVKGK